MTIYDALHLIPGPRIAVGLRDNEEGIVGEIKGDVFALVACYRLIARSLSHGFIPTYDAMPKRLHVNKKQFHALYERVESTMIDAAELYLKLIPFSYQQYEMFEGIDTDAKREQRARFYAKQNQRIEQQYGLEPDPSTRLGPKKRPVIAKLPEGPKRFPSARKAAEWVRINMGIYIRRSDIRTALRKGHRCAGLDWEYDVKAKKEAKVVEESQYMLWGAAA